MCPSIMLAPYPSTMESWSTWSCSLATEAERAMDFVLAVVGAVRKQRNDYGIARQQRPHLFVVTSDYGMSMQASIRRRIRDCDRVFILYRQARYDAAAAARAGDALREQREDVPRGCSVAIVDEVTTAHLLLKDILNPAQELVRLDKKVWCGSSVFIKIVGMLIPSRGLLVYLPGQASELAARVAQLKTRMAAPKYVKTPEHVQTADRARLAKAEGEAVSTLAASLKMRELLAEAS